MRQLRPYLIILALFLLGGVIVAYAQTSSLTVGGLTINAGTAAVSVNAPTRNGTLALKEDIPTNPPGTTVFAGQFAVAGSTTFSGLTATPVCSVTPRFTTTTTGLQLTGVDYVCTAKNH